MILRGVLANRVALLFKTIALLLALCSFAPGGHGQSGPGIQPAVPSPIGVFRPTDQTCSGLAGWYLNSNGDLSSSEHGCFGFGSDTPLTGDWNGSGTVKIGVFRANDSTCSGLAGWYLNPAGDLSSAQKGCFGFASDIPVVGDWSGNGTAKIGVFRPNDSNCSATGTAGWYLNAAGDLSSAQQGCFGFGSDTPIVGDWSGGGTTKIGVFRANDSSCSGLAGWYLNVEGDLQPTSAQRGCFGFASDIPFVGDWSGTGTAKIGVFRANDSTCSGAAGWYLNTTGDLSTAQQGCFGFATDTPIVGDWNGSGTTKIGVIRPNDPSCPAGVAGWYLNVQGDLQPTSYQHGCFGFPSDNDLRKQIQNFAPTPGVLAKTSGDANPDPQPASYPNLLASAPSAPSGGCNVTGTWADSASGATWSLVQTGSAITGQTSGAPPPQYGCPASITWQVTGGISGSTMTLTASNPEPSSESCVYVRWTSSTVVQAIVQLTNGCTNGPVAETATYPPGSQFAPGGGGSGTVSGTGTFSETTSPITFTLSSQSQIPIPGLPNAQMVALSTGDTNIQLTTTSSIQTYGMDVVYSSPFTADAYSTCSNDVNHVNLVVADGTGTGSATSSISASPAGCSGTFAVWGNVGGTTTQNDLTIVVPPQILIQMLYGEAHGQTTAGDTVSEQAIGAAVRNRFGDSTYFPSSTTYQNTITPGQFASIRKCQAAGNCVQNGTSPELNNAVLIYGGVPTDAMNVANAKCFFSPDADEWGAIQPLIGNSSVTVVPMVADDPGCFPTYNRQFVQKTSVPGNTNGTGAPAFIFVQYKKSTAPAVISIP